MSLNKKIQIEISYQSGGNRQAKQPIIRSLLHSSLPARNRTSPPTVSWTTHHLSPVTLCSPPSGSTSPKDTRGLLACGVTPLQLCFVLYSCYVLTPHEFRTRTETVTEMLSIQRNLFKCCAGLSHKMFSSYIINPCLCHRTRSLT